MPNSLPLLLPEFRLYCFYLLCSRVYFSSMNRTQDCACHHNSGFSLFLSSSTHCIPKWPMLGLFTFSFQQFELLASSQKVLSEEDEDESQRDGCDEDVRPHNGHGEDGSQNNQRQLETWPTAQQGQSRGATVCVRANRTLQIHS